MSTTRCHRSTALLIAILIAGPAGAGPLEDYIERPDTTYAWRTVMRFERLGAEVAVLRLDSQTWRDVVWKHQMYVIKPRGADLESGRAIVIVGGGRWRDRYDTEVPSEMPRDAKLFLRMAKRLGTVVAVLGQVPFQPLFSLTEDQLIAYTFDEYLKTQDPDWPLLLPMVKSVVRAMDATSAFAQDSWGADIDKYTVLGGSKRGWTTWLTGVADDRADALAPVVIDVLNFAEHFPHQVDMWGAPSASIQPYTERNLTNVLASDAGRELRAIVDPYSYRDVLTQPKLIVMATNDSYFPVDSLNLYWDGLEGEKYALYLPNDGHNIKDYGRLLPTVAAFNRHAAHGMPLPQLAWEFKPAADTIALCLRSDIRPSKVQVWVAHSDDLDFRDASWSSSRIARDDTMIARIERPANGYTAFYLEARFGHLRSAYSLSTNLRIFGAPGLGVPGRVPQTTAAVCPSSL